jgi:uridylate kinase
LEKNNIITRKKRILLKLSGELFSSDLSHIDRNSILKIVSEIKSVSDNKNFELAIIVGGGNIWRGADNNFMDRVHADKMGMLATVINAIALSDLLNKNSIKSRVFSNDIVTGLVEKFDKDLVVKCIEKGEIVIFAGGTGRVLSTTDTSSAVRAIDIKADVLLKATKVDGIYNADPKKNKNAVKFEKISFDDAINKQLKVMDLQSFSLCKNMNIPIIVFDFCKKGNLKKVLDGEKIGTMVNGL